MTRSFAHLRSSRPRVRLTAVAVLTISASISPLAACVRDEASTARASQPSANPPASAVEEEEESPEADTQSENKDAEQTPLLDRGDPASERIDLARQDDVDADDALLQAEAPDARPDEVVQAEKQVKTTLQERARAMEERELELAKKDQDLRRIEATLSSQLEKIAALEDRLQRELGIGKASEDRRSERIASLAELIMTMPPQPGAEIMSNMSDIDAQDILLAIARKNGRKAAKVLAQMPAERAAGLGQLYLSSDATIPGSEGLIPKSEPSVNAGKP